MSLICLENKSAMQSQRRGSILEILVPVYKYDMMTDVRRYLRGDYATRMNDHGEE